MPHVIVKLAPGKSERQKTLLAYEITLSVMRTLESDEESVSVGFEEVQPNDWASKVYEPDIVGNEKTLYKKPGYTI